MNKLNPQHLHLFIDEPIYVLDEPLVAQDETPEVNAAEITEKKKVAEPEPEFIPTEVKDILIINEDTNNQLLSTADEIFLFKGLNALNIDKNDVLIHNTSSSGQLKPPFRHKKQIAFKIDPDEQKLYQVLDATGILHLECHLLGKISADLTLKKQFWLGLKALFEG